MYSKRDWVNIIKKESINEIMWKHNRRITKL
jgi:hypothetical protein